MMYANVMLNSDEFRYCLSSQFSCDNRLEGNVALSLSLSPPIAIVTEYLQS